MPKRHLHLKEFFRKLHQKKGIRFVLYLFMNLTLPFVGFYAHFIEPRLVKISHLRIPISKMTTPLSTFRIVQISDIHFGPTNGSVKYLRKCIALINRLKPDMVALTGDFMQWDSKYARPLARVLASIKSGMGTFAILGNHDYGVCHPHEPPTDPVDHREVIRELRANGIRVLHNAAAIIRKGSEKLKIVGLGDYWTPFFKPDKAFNGSEKITPTILLSHNPDSIEKLKDFPFDLMLSGHGHGGQFSLPWIGPLAVPVKHRHLRRGLHHIGEKWLYANRGLGFTFKARLLSRPEITCFELVPS